MPGQTSCIKTNGAGNLYFLTHSPLGAACLEVAPHHWLGLGGATQSIGRKINIMLLGVSIITYDMPHTT